MADSASHSGLQADIGLTFTGRLLITHDLVPTLDPGEPARGAIVLDFHTDPGAAPDGLPAEITVDADSGQFTVTLFGDYSVHDVLAGHVADLRARLRETAVSR